MPLSRIDSVTAEFAYPSRSISSRFRIDDVALNAVGLAHAMNPETIEPDFLDRYNLDRRCDALLGSALQPRKKVEQFARVTADERVVGRLPAAERQ